MLQHLYKNAHRHYQLKLAVEHKITSKYLTIYSSKDVSSLIFKHAHSYVKGDKSNTSDLRHKQLVSNIRDVSKGISIPSEIKASMFLVEQLMATFINHHSPSYLLQQVSYMFTLCWFQACVLDPKKAVEDDSDFYEILQNLANLSLKIDQYSGAISRNLCHEFFKLFYQSSKSGLSNDQLFNKAILQPFNQLEKESNKKQRENLLKNIKEYKVTINKKTAKSVVAEEIRRGIGDGIYPIVLLDFVENYITLFMEKHFVEHGQRSAVWKETIKELSYLIWAFRAKVDMTYHRYFLEKIPPALENLLTKIEPFVEDKKKLYNDVLGIETILDMRRDKGFIKLDAVFNVTELSSESLYTNLSARWYDSNEKKGEWFLLQYKDKEVLCKALKRDIIKKHIVFSNHSGKLQFIFDASEPGFHLGQVQSTPAVCEIDWEYILSTIDYEASNQQADFCETYHDFIVEIDHEVAQETARNMEKQKRYEKQLEEKNRLMREKIERERQAVEDLKHKQQQQLFEKKKADHQKRKQCEIDAEKIQVGTTVSAILEDGTQAQLELNLITTTTKRYIFNDKSCQHKLALRKENIIEMMVAGTLKVELLGRGVVHSQSLESIIASNRNQLNRKNII